MAEFSEFLRVNMRLEPSTVRETVIIIKRFLRYAKNLVSYQTITDYLKLYLNKASKTYNTQIVCLRRFVRDFLGFGNLIPSFKMAPVDYLRKPTDISREQVKAGFYAQPDPLSKALYLFTATTGLRKGEILSLKRGDVDLEGRIVKASHFTRAKRSGVTFFNKEAEEWLRKYLEERKDDDPKLFPISERQWRKIWRRASKAAGVKITSKALRVWFSTEMGELGIPDRYVDVFQGRAPRNIIAMYYTGKGLDRLKRIYNKADLRVLG